MPKLTNFEEYKDKYQHVRMTRDAEGVLTMAMHTKGGSVFWDFVAHDELAFAFADVAGDPENAVVVYTGTGANFNSDFDWGAIEQGQIPPPEMMAHAGWTGHSLIMNMLDIQAPIVAAVNGPCAMHSELVLMCNSVVASEDAWFQDAPHFPMGVVPGDGMHVVWPMVAGPVRASHFLTSGMKLPAREALAWGAVNEVVPKDQVLQRALAIAHEIAKKPPMTRRYTRALLAQPFRKAMVEELSHGILGELYAQRGFWPKGNGPMVNSWKDPKPFG